MYQGPAMSSKTRSWALLAALILLAAGIFVWMSRGKGGAAPSAPSTNVQGSGPARAMNARPPRGPVAAGPRGPLRLAEGAAEHDDSTANGAFEGRVVSWGTGKGVPGATISFARDGQTSAINAGGDGGFRFIPTEAGLYEIAMVAAEGYLPFAPAFGESPLKLMARRGSRIRDIRIYLQPASEYTGVVLSPTGDPVKGAAVRLFDESGGEAKIAPLPDRFTSDERGELRFSAPDDAILEARSPGFSPGRASVDLAAQAGRRVVVKLGPKTDAARSPGVIAGRVVDAKGAPVLGALVRATSEAPIAAKLKPAPRLRPEATTDERGQFSLLDLEEDTYTVIATHNDLAPASAAGVRAGTLDLTLTLRSGATLRGTVRAEKGGGSIAAFTVVVWTRRGPLERDIFAAEAFFDAEGRYEVGGLAPGDYAVTAAAHGFAASAEAAFTVPDPAADPAPIDIALPRGGRVSGVVVEDGTGQPLEGARVSVEGRSGAGPSAASVLSSTTTDASGRFAIHGIGAGLQSIMVIADGHHSRIVSGLAVAEDGDVGPITVELRKTEKGEAPRLELTGIGAVLAPKGEALMIGEVIEGGGAREAGLGAGDAIMAVDGARVVDVGFDGAVQRIRGPEGSRVTLSVKKAAGGDAVDVSVPRRRIHP